MSDTCECQDRPGTSCSRCFSPDSVSEIVDDDGEVLATNEDDSDSNDSCECEDKPGTCCSQCLAPDATTETAEWDPEEMAFAQSYDYADIPIILGGDGYTFTFTVYPGEGLDYAYISVETDENWPDGSFHIYDDEGNPVSPYDLQELDADGTTYTGQIDPSYQTVEGDYTGAIKVRRVNATETEEDENEIPVTWTAEDNTDLEITFYGNEHGRITVAAPGDEGFTTANFKRRSGSSNLYWRLEFGMLECPKGLIIELHCTDWPATTSYELWNNDTGTQIDETLIYGPITTDDVVHASIKVDTTGMSPGEWYLGRLTLTGYEDAAGNTRTNDQTRVVIVTLDSKRELVLVAPTVVRGLDFDLDIEAQFVETGLIDEDYGQVGPDESPGSLDIQLICEYAPPDEVAPVLVEGEDIEWTLGETTLEDLQITGGSGSQPWLYVKDRLTLAQGFAQLQIADPGPPLVCGSSDTRYWLKSDINWPIANWQAAYDGFVSDDWDDFAGNDRALSISRKGITWVESDQVSMYTRRMDSAAQAGKAYTKIECNIGTYQDRGLAVFYISVIPSESTSPPTDVVGELWTSPKARVTAAGLQTFTLDQPFIAATYLYVFIWEDPYVEPVGGGSANDHDCRVLAGTNFTIKN